MSKPIALVIGLGPGTGAAVARRFSQSYPVVCLARTPASYDATVADIKKAGGQAIGISTDVSDAKSVTNAFDQIKKEFGADVGVAAAVFNASGAFVRKPILELTEDEFMANLNVSAKGAFLFTQAALPLLLNATNGQHPPTLIYTGATASVKSSANMAAFSTGKYALRALSQSVAKEYGPKGIHVAHSLIDGVINIEKTKGYMLNAGPDAKISPDAIADAYWYLHTQPLSSFTNELDIRPAEEKW